MVEELDWLDKALIFELYSNARIPIQVLCKKYDVAFNTIKNRIKKLEKKGVILEYCVELSMEMLGAEWLYVEITTNGTEDIEEFVNQIGNHPLVRFSNQISTQKYQARAIVTGANEIFELKHFIKSISSVIEFQMHPFVWIAPTALPSSKARTKGHRIVFTKNQLQILHCLANDVRMPVTEISKRTNIPIRKVNKILEELHEGGGVHFTIRMMMADPVELIIFLRYDDKKIDINHIVEWFQKRYPLEFWGGACWLNEPVFEVIIVPGKITVFSDIIRQVRAAPFTISVQTHLFSSDSLLRGQYRGPSHTRLEEMFRKAGLVET